MKGLYPAAALAETRYDAASITVLSGLEAVRRNPGMYIGATDQSGLHQLVFELVDNAIDEARAGCCTRITVTLLGDGGCAVTDDGRGIPVALHPSEGLPACQVVLTRLHAGGKFGRQAYRYSAGLHGVGLSCLNALSSRLSLEVWRDGGHYHQGYAAGEPLTPLVRLGDTQRHGTQITFSPDPAIFAGATSFSRPVLAERLRELAFLHPGLHLRLEEQRFPAEVEDFCQASGIAGFLDHLTAGEPRLHPEPLLFRFQDHDLAGAIGLQWTGGYAGKLLGFVNGVNTVNGGTHLDGLKSGLARAINGCASELGLLHRENGEQIATLDILEGLVAVVSLHLADPEFEGQTKTRVTTPRLAARIEALVTTELRALLRGEAQLATRVVGRALDAGRARAAARRVGERLRAQAGSVGFAKEVYQKQFGIRSKNWHQSASWITHAELLAEHARHLDLPGRPTLLDVCCGSGVVGAAFGDQVGEKIGLDITPEMLALARTRLDRVVQGNVYHLPFRDQCVELVVNREVLHLLPAPERPVAEIFRVLKPGGQFIVGQILPYGPDDAAWMYRVFKKKQPLVCNMFQEEDFHELLAGAGFVDLRMSEYRLWESIDLWIDTHETTPLHRQEIRELFHHCPQEARAVHPFEITASGEIRDLWRWCVFSARKPG
ncbi:MAG: methyltransferase domain-containing protein [Desulfobulbaceae bacterium]|nr:methyltransferase domain-containing protein [Desulfobulbaceae bacterium]